MTYQRFHQLLWVLLCLSVTDTTFAGIYKCTSPSGKTVYSEKPCNANNSSEVIKPSSHKPSNTGATTSYSIPEVDIYITSWCPYCKKAMAYLDSQGIYYNKYDIEYDAEAAAKKRQLVPGYSGVPLTVINGQVIRGFSEHSFERALKQ